MNWAMNALAWVSPVDVRPSPSSRDEVPLPYPGIAGMGYSSFSFVYGSAGDLPARMIPSRAGSRNCRVRLLRDLFTVPQ